MLSGWINDPAIVPAQDSFWTSSGIAGALVADLRSRAGIAARAAGAARRNNILSKKLPPNRAGNPYALFHTLPAPGEG